MKWAIERYGATPAVRPLSGAAVRASPALYAIHASALAGAISATTSTTPMRSDNHFLLSS
jgi:hypothetical protein